MKKEKQPMSAETEKLITEVLGSGLPPKWQADIQTTVRQELQKLEELRLADIKRRLDSREKIRVYLMWLLVGQNVAVFGLVAIALYINRLEGLQLIFSTLTTATLLETTAAI